MVSYLLQLDTQEVKFTTEANYYHKSVKFTIETDAHNRTRVNIVDVGFKIEASLQ